MNDNELVIARSELDALHDDLYVLACAVDDTEKDLASMGKRPTIKELSETLDWLLEAAKPLRAREFSAPQANSQ